MSKICNVFADFGESESGLSPTFLSEGELQKTARVSKICNDLQALAEVRADSVRRTVNQRNAYDEGKRCPNDALGSNERTSCGNQRKAQKPKGEEACFSAAV